jgi:hypothetical protein
VFSDPESARWEMLEHSAIIKTQISIGGPNRSGKSTLAGNLAMALAEIGCTTGIIDVDITRTSTFGNDEPVLGTFDHTTDDGKRKFDLQKKMQGWTYNNVFDVQIPLVTGAAAIPIFAATHANVLAYDRGERVAKKLGNRFLFFLLEATSFEEMCRRCQHDLLTTSDMRGDVANNKALRENWESINRRLEETYGPKFSRPVFRIPQGTPEEMLQQAMSRILNL